jgi:hypothetical protein
MGLNIFFYLTLLVMYDLFHSRVVECRIPAASRGPEAGATLFPHAVEPCATTVIWRKR